MGFPLTHKDKTDLRPMHPFTEGVHAPLPMIARSRRVLRSLNCGHYGCLGPVRTLAAIEPCLMTELFLAARFYEPDAVVDTLEDALRICSHHEFSEMLLSSDNSCDLAQCLPGETHQWLISNFTSCIARELVTLLAPASIAPTVAAEAGLLHNVIFYLQLGERVDNVRSLDCCKAVALLPEHIVAVARGLDRPQSTEYQPWSDLIYIVTLAREMARFGCQHGSSSLDGFVLPKAFAAGGAVPMSLRPPVPLLQSIMRQTYAEAIASYDSLELGNML